MSFSAKGFFFSSTPSASPAVDMATESGWVLHILNGPQSQVQTRLTIGRHLVGNDPASCDLIIETGDQARHLAIVWVDGQSVSLTVVTGEAWRGSEPFPDNVYQELKGGEVLTLGRVSFVLAPAGFDFGSAQPPLVLNRPESADAEATHPLPIRSRINRHIAKTLRYGALLSSVIAMAITLLWASGMATAGRNFQLNTQLELTDLQREAAALGFEEVHYEHQGEPRLLIAKGYVANGAIYANLERKLSELPEPGIVRVTRVDGLLRSLSGRDGIQAEFQVSYLGNGQFAAEVSADVFPAYRDLVAQAFRDHTGINSVLITISDIVSIEHRASALITMRRLPGTLGRVETTGDELPLITGTDEFGQYAEVRIGRMPSIVTADGRRLFEGATLSDGSVVERISAREVQVLRSGFRRELSVQGSIVLTDSSARPRQPLSGERTPANTMPAPSLVLKTDLGY